MDAKCMGCKNNETAICNKCDMFYDEFEPIETPTITNADRIRAMTDEELAEWLAHYTSWTEFGEKMAKERWLIYLRQEATND